MRFGNKDHFTFINSIFLSEIFFINALQNRRQIMLNLITFTHSIETASIVIGLSGPQNNGNDRIFNTPEISRTVISPSDVNYCHTKNTILRGSYLSAVYTVRVKDR